MPLIFKRGRHDDLGAQMRALTRGRVRQIAAGAIRDELELLIDERFDARADPYGKPWAPRKKPTGTWPLLEKTKAMRRDYHVTATASGVKVENGRPYSGYHQTGTGRMPARKALPDGDLPRAWRDRIDAQIIAELKRAK